MQTDEQKIRDVISNWMRASLAGDNQTVLSLMSDDVVFLVPGQPPMGKEAFKAAQGGMQQLNIDGKSVVKEIQIAGEWAYCITHLSVTITPKEGGAAKKREGHTLSVFRKKPDGNWVLARDANLLAPVP